MTISLTIPNEFRALMRASEMLSGMAADLQADLPTLAPTLSTVTWPLHQNGRVILVDTPISAMEFAQLPIAYQSEWAGEFLPKPIVPETEHTIDSAEASVAAPDLIGQPGEQAIAEAIVDTINAITNIANGTPAEAATVFTPTPEPGVELDSAGRPHDPRIHSSSKGKLAKGGGWKLKRGLDKELVATVEAELDALMAVPAAEVPPQAQAPVPTPTPTPTPTPVPTPTPTLVPTPGAGPLAFPALVGLITAAKLDDDTVTAACVKHGIPGFPLLGSRPDLVPAVAKELGLIA